MTSIEQLFNDALNLMDKDYDESFLDTCANMTLTAICFMRVQEEINEFVRIFSHE